METISNPLPHLRYGEEGIHLMVKGSPFLMRAGELHNSSLSSARFMSQVWQPMKDQSINTLLGAVYWEMIEPVEGQFNFEELDAVLTAAREHDMHLVLLWFGTYKNGISTYAPSWVKRDVRRFPRVRITDSSKPGKKKTIEMITPFSEECCRADSRAFSALMSHLAAVDAEHNTVLMIQVQNETGLLGDTRDRSPRAEVAFAEPVPKHLLAYFHTHASELHPSFRERYFDNLPPPPSESDDETTSSSYTWSQIFTPKDADEAFMAHHISTYVSSVAAAGRSAYPIPVYTNTWLNFTNAATDLELHGIPIELDEDDNDDSAKRSKAGIYYPSGGPCPNVLDIWRCNARRAVAAATTTAQETSPPAAAALGAFDFLAPDLYVHNYEKTCQDYTAHKDNALFIPEQRRDPRGARRMWVAYATYGALGAAPFGIDTLEKEKEREQGAKKEEVGVVYGLLERTASYLLGSSPDRRFGFWFDEVLDIEEGGEEEEEEKEKEKKEVGKLKQTWKAPPTGRERWSKIFCGGRLEVIVERAFVFGRPGPGGGYVVQLGDDPETSTRFLCVGKGFNVSFRAVGVPEATFCGILSAVEKEAVRGNKNGDDWELRTLRTFNGDETRSGEFLIMPNDDPDYGGFPIAVTVPAGTGIAEVEAYWVCEEE